MTLDQEKPPSSSSTRARPERAGRAARRTATPDATFAGQTDALAEVDTLEAYTEWMKGLMTSLPDGNAPRCRSFAVDEKRNNVAVFGVFRGTHTGEGGPVPPTGKSRGPPTTSTSWTSTATRSAT